MPALQILGCGQGRERQRDDGHLVNFWELPYPDILRDVFARGVGEPNATSLHLWCPQQVH